MGYSMGCSMDYKDCTDRMGCMGCNMGCMGYTGRMGCTDYSMDCTDYSMDCTDYSMDCKGRMGCKGCSMGCSSLEARAQVAAETAPIPLGGQLTTTPCPLPSLRRLM